MSMYVYESIFMYCLERGDNSKIIVGKFNTE